MKLQTNDKDDLFKLAVAIAEEQDVCEKAVRMMAVKVMNNALKADSSVLKRIYIDETFFTRIGVADLLLK